MSDKDIDYESFGITGETHMSPCNGLPYELYINGDGLAYGTPAEAYEALKEDTE